MNIIISSVFELPAYILSGIIYETLGIKIALISLYSISILGTITYMLLETEDNAMIAGMISFIKFGVSGTLNISFLANAGLFPAIFGSTAFGICNIFARIMTILAPIVAEANVPIPLITFNVMAGVGIIASFFFVTKPPKAKWINEFH